MMFCNVCGIVDEYYDENSEAEHNATQKHICNTILLNYNNNKRCFASNRDGVKIVCHSESLPFGDAKIMKVENIYHLKIRMTDVGQFEMPIMFTIIRKAQEKKQGGRNEKTLIFVREMVVSVQEDEVTDTFVKSPYTNEKWPDKDVYLLSLNQP
ncbi:unnamed protein product [Leptidea sinapis]|uniref:Uncharacterized protein n=1 Tax=Leptidea sinapis TaxID=189913 RepID=A0A5E4QAV4_9NEOP|nr:unnamed protein product [Leptidea sinapis]